MTLQLYSKFPVIVINHCDKGPQRPQNPISHCSQDVSIGPIAVGEEFSSSDELNQRIIHFETKSFVQLYVRRSRSLEATIGSEQPRRTSLSN